MVWLNPWLLLALLFLPAVWWLLRMMPPPLRRERFPPLALLRKLVSSEETPAHTSWWLLVLRCVAVVLLIVALAHPVFYPDRQLPHCEAILLVVDDGWAAANHWRRLTAVVEEVAIEAERREVLLYLLATAPSADNNPWRGPLSLRQIRQLLEEWQPQSWPVDRPAATGAIMTSIVPAQADLENLSIHTIWLSDGLDSEGTAELVERLEELGSLEVRIPKQLPLILLPPRREGKQVQLSLMRAGDDPEAIVHLLGSQGQVLAQESINFEPETSEPRANQAGTRVGSVSFDLPAALSNQISRIHIDQQLTAGAVILLDERWRQRAVGLVSDDRSSSSHPLLDELFYLRQALELFSVVYHGAVDQLLTLPVLVLSDTAGALSSEQIDQLSTWLDGGGMLIRFAGPGMIQHPDRLIPVPLQHRERTLDGALSWLQPARFQEFAADSPFAGLPIPDEVKVTRQVLARQLGGHEIWARLEDGTPIVTARRQEQGWLVLVHTNTDWSNLALSDLFVGMLLRLVEHSKGIQGAAPQELLVASEQLDGFGRLGEPLAHTLPIPGSELHQQQVDFWHPPGFYAPERSEGVRYALNLTDHLTELTPLVLPEAIERRSYALDEPFDLKPWLLSGLWLVLLLELLASLFLRGLWPVMSWPRVGKALRSRIPGIRL